MATFVALLRGINVGGHQQVRMTDLKELYEASGCENVVTYIQTGNVVFTSNGTDPTQLANRLEESFTQKFGFRAAVVVRTAAQFNAIVEHNPFQAQLAQEPKWVVVLFLAGQPAVTALVDLRQAYAGPEEFQIIGQELYLYYPEGIGRSKLSNVLLEKKLQTAGTARNWNTVLQLQKILQRVLS